MVKFHSISVSNPNGFFKLTRNGQLVTLLAIADKGGLPHYKVYNHTSKAQSYEPVEGVEEYSATIIPLFKKAPIANPLNPDNPDNPKKGA